MQVEGDDRLRRPRHPQVAQRLRAAARIGVVFPLPVGLPLTHLRQRRAGAAPGGVKKKAELDEIVERCLQRAALWDEVKDRLNSLGSLLSGGQQQRLTIARALSQDPDLLLLDEFSIAVDPVTTMRIEDVLKELKKEITIVLVTNLVQQARRLADRTAFFLMGECVEVGRDRGSLHRRRQRPAHAGLRGGALWMSRPALAIETEKLNLWYGTFQALFDVDLRSSRASSPR